MRYVKSSFMIRPFVAPIVICETNNLRAEVVAALRQGETRISVRLKPRLRRRFTFVERSSDCLV
jgi:hypothetical protein